MENAISTLLKEGTSLHVAGDLEAAEIKYRSVLLEKIDHPVAHNNLGFLLLQKGSYDESVSEYRLAIQFSPDYSTAHSNLGQALLIQRKFNEAEEALSRAVELDPQDLKAIDALAKCYMLAGAPDEAENYLKKSYSLNPQNETLLDLVWCFVRQQKLEDAHMALQYREQEFKGNARYYSLYGMLQFMSSNFGSAIYYFRQSLGLEPENIETRNSLAACLIKTGATDQARVEMQRILLIQPDHIESLNNLGVLEIASAAFDESMEYFNKVLLIDPANVKAQYYKAMLLIYQHDIQGARRLLQQIIKSGVSPYVIQAAEMLEQLEKDGHE
jgi:Flp pilus assembly protein TadD